MHPRSAFTRTVALASLFAGAIAAPACGASAGHGAGPPVDMVDAQDSDVGFGDAGFADPFGDGCAERGGTAVCSGDAGSLCPASEPAEGAPCPAVSAQIACTYGDSAAPACRVLVRCDPCSQTWRHDRRSIAGSGGALCGASACAVAPDAGAVCGASAICDVPGGTFCACAGGIWTCSPPPRTAGCPATIPNEGTCCDPAIVSTECAYGDGFGNCGDSVTVTCDPKTRSFFWQFRCVVLPASP